MKSLCFSAMACLTTSLASAGVLPSGYCAITVASRQSIEEVADYVAQNMPPAVYEDARVFLSENGWYGITIGLVEWDEFAELKDELIRSRRAPADVFCANGQKYISEVNREAFLPEGFDSIQASTPPDHTDEEIDAFFDELAAGLQADEEKMAAYEARREAILEEFNRYTGTYLGYVEAAYEKKLAAQTAEEKPQFLFLAARETLGRIVDGAKPHIATGNAWNSDCLPYDETVKDAAAMRFFPVLREETRQPAFREFVKATHPESDLLFDAFGLYVDDTAEEPEPFFGGFRDDTPKEPERELSGVEDTGNAALDAKLKAFREKIDDQSYCWPSWHEESALEPEEPLAEPTSVAAPQETTRRLEDVPDLTGLDLCNYNQCLADNATFIQKVTSYGAIEVFYADFTFDVPVGIGYYNARCFGENAYLDAPKTQFFVPNGLDNCTDGIVFQVYEKDYEQTAESFSVTYHVQGYFRIMIDQMGKVYRFIRA